MYLNKPHDMIAETSWMALSDNLITGNFIYFKVLGSKDARTLKESNRGTEVRKLDKCYIKQG